MLNVIGAGFGRTGTTSLKVALEHLGFGPCFHMYELLAKPELMDDWIRLADGETVPWDQVFAGYSSTVDWPGTSYWRELVDAHPEAKVILTDRDADRWYESTYNTIYSLANSEPPAQGDEVDAVAARFRPVLHKLIWDGEFDGRFADRDHAIEVFHRHNAEVRRYVPADRLLVFRVSQGWQPLCDFLGVDVPDAVFPHVNDTASMPELMRRIRSQGAVPSPL
ncbi:hypothetical protein A8924_6292 [Saccharopolyspora erythraea NRRL 2338]|uniref:Uncharacterized protein n=2 Tax=Saccharopolyspora erythraea TaxID=1836 RepID=A4FM55_SACEN|nr:sulfotransferase family protein [Saccharopolyspora erythraea]EQD84623.1 hypothetical protein N599_19190 [Saccharopolyspora erythraea D]PFG98768.1 hypothetical protein A8924_6292 [Saccharopolyspora erythraea NRRL 2338]QRK88772.1 sulfotransferase family protein [Saccharopolyspora erythraea]CAM05130.1 hypothetical protein SACE_5947 [Saccharopolyspora erythraea NRRL 2338]